MKATPLIVAGVAGLTLAGCGTIFEEDLNRVTADVQEWKQANLGPQQAQASQEQPSATQRQPSATQEQPSAAQGATAPKAADPQLVRNVQKELKAEGINPGPIDGIWGPKTSRGVREFQKAQNLEETGQLNGKTLSALGIAGGQTAAAGAGAPSAQAAAARAGMATGDSDKNVKMQR
jgi:peptidoglycan hydrolase-like protein with peptidoglycan-binding domain